MKRQCRRRWEQASRSESGGSKAMDLCDAFDSIVQHRKERGRDRSSEEVSIIIVNITMSLVQFPGWEEGWGAERDVFNVISVGFVCVSQRSLKRNIAAQPLVKLETPRLPIFVLKKKMQNAMFKADLHDCNRHVLKVEQDLASYFSLFFLVSRLKPTQFLKRLN